MIDLLNEIPLAGLMLVVALGFSLGRVQLRGLSLGPAGGTLVVALLFGRVGLDFHALYGTGDPRLTLGTLGFALFIYSVGFEAGPRFFASLRGGLGLRFVIVGTLVTALAVTVAVAMGTLLSLGGAVTAGLLAGALTSAPTYAAASQGAAEPGLLAVSFAITYPFGLAGVVLLVQFLPRWMGDDLAHGTSALEEERAPAAGGGPELTRAFEIRQPDAVGRTLAELDLRASTGCTLTRLHRGAGVRVPDADTRLEEGDHVMARGRLDALQRLSARLGPEVYDEDLRSVLASPRAIHVSAPDVIGCSLRALDLVRRHHCIVTAIQHAGVTLEPVPELRLERDDVVLVAGERDDVRAVARRLGRFERSTQETDIAVYAGGILLGLLLGEVEFGGVGLGAAGGLLLVGVLLGRFRRIGPFSAHVPVAARQLVRDLGILLFIAETGVRAGGRPLEGGTELLAPMLLAGAFVTVVPMLGALLFGRRLLAMRPVDAWGAVCGGMTSSAALLAIRRAADSNEPAIGYAASYAVASVLATLAGPLVLWFMG